MRGWVVAGLLLLAATSLPAQFLSNLEPERPIEVEDAAPIPFRAISAGVDWTYNLRRGGLNDQGPGWSLLYGAMRSLEIGAAQRYVTRPGRNALRGIASGDLEIHALYGLLGETAQRAGRTLVRMLDGEIEPVMVWGSRPMMTSTLVHAPSRQPMRDIMDMAIAAETSGAVLSASVFGGFPHADIPHTSLSAVIVCDRRADQGQVLLDRLLSMAWERRDAFLYTGAPLASQIAHARTLGDGPVVLVDHGDNTASGGTQDVMSVIEEVMRQGLEDVVAGPICDPATVKRLVNAGTAAGVTLSLGGKIDMPQINLPGKPLAVTGKVTRITDGEFVVTGPMATGTRVRMGRTAVLDTGPMQIVVAERRSEPFDLGVFTHCGIDPRRKKYVLIKSRQHFRAGFEPIARHIVMCDGDGCTSSDLRIFTFRNRRRPLYPFEDGGGS